jgi:hypothetical protein
MARQKEAAKLWPLISGSYGKSHLPPGAVA